MSIDEKPAHVLGELGHVVSRVGDELHGRAPVVSNMHVPGTQHLRTSILAIWADILTGLLVAETVAPRVPVTVELDVHVYGPPPGEGTVLGVGRPLRSGNSLFVAGVEFSTAAGEPIGVGGASFMMAPDPNLRLPPNLTIDSPPSERLLTVPFAERAGCERVSPGVATLHRSDDGLNSSRTVNGGLIALAAEEAVLSLAPGEVVSSLALRYLQPVRVGPVVATATWQRRLGQVELRDSGSGNRLAAVATCRTTPAV